MKATLQDQIAPIIPQNNGLDFSDVKVQGDNKAIDSTQPDKVNFKDLILNSEEEIRKEREAKKNNDLSTAKSDKEFFEKLQDMSKPKVEAKHTMGKDDFLKLFVAQLQHQDPLNPDDGAEMASKLAQFNSLEQMMNVNTTLEKMAEGQNSDKTARLVDYLNREVTTAGGRIRLDKGKLASEATYELPKEATSATLQVRDASGTVVAEKNLGSLAQGTHLLKWDGKNDKGEKLPDGNYTYSLSAKDLDSMEIPVTLVSRSTIVGVDLKDKDGGLYTEHGKIKFEDIVSLGNPGYRKFAQDALKTAPKSTASTGESLEQMKVQGNLELGAKAKEAAEGQKLEPADAKTPSENEVARPVTAKAESKPEVKQEAAKTETPKEPAIVNQDKIS